MRVKICPLLLLLVFFGKTPAFTRDITGVRSGQSSLVEQMLRDTLPETEAVRKGLKTENTDRDALFPGGEIAWRRYIEQSVDPTVPGKNKAPAGTYTVIVEFLVDSSGKLTSIKAQTHLGYGMEAEVIRILRKSPRWIPAIQGGKPGRSIRNQPVTFKVVADIPAKKTKG